MPEETLTTKELHILFEYVSGWYTEGGIPRILPPPDLITLNLLKILIKKNFTNTVAI